MDAVYLLLLAYAFLMSSLKRAQNDENIPPENQGSTTSIQPQLSGIFRNGLKRRRVVRKDVTEEELRVLREKRAAEEAKEMAEMAPRGDRAGRQGAAIVVMARVSLMSWSLVWTGGLAKKVVRAVILAVI